MDTQQPTPQRLRESVIAVPPLARDPQLRLAAEENRRIVRHLESGGVSHLLYGGNAMLYHVRPSEYAALLEMLAETVGPRTLVTPSVGPTFGVMMDQIDVLTDHAFPAVMVLPQRDIADPAGIARGIRLFAERSGLPIVLYLKFDRWLEADTVRRMWDDGLISWIKYAVVRDDPAEDAYLREILDVVPKQHVVSGIGEQPAIVHLRDFGVGGYTSGCVCVAPRRSMEMLAKIQAEDWDAAEAIRRRFEGLEDLRNAISPIGVLHRAVDLAGIAATGPMLPLLGELSAPRAEAVKRAAEELLDWDRRAAADVSPAR